MKRLTLPSIMPWRPHFKVVLAHSHKDSPLTTQQVQISAKGALTTIQCASQQIRGRLRRPSLVRAQHTALHGCTLRRPAILLIGAAEGMPYASLTGRAELWLLEDVASLGYNATTIAFLRSLDWELHGFPYYPEQGWYWYAWRNYDFRRSLSGYT
jgi:hypothetical protein